jgi:tetratricopeptide (TPR) repeat protein
MDRGSQFLSQCAHFVWSRLALPFVLAAAVLLNLYALPALSQPGAGDAGLLVHQGVLLLRDNKNQEAADKLAQAVALAPAYAEAHHNYALALAKLGKTDDSLKEFKQALNLNPDLDSAWLSMGGLYQSSGQLPDAISAYKQFLSRFPTHKDAAKVASLVKGLEKEYQQSGPTVNPDGTPTNDYFAQVTREGILRWPAKRMPIKICIANGADVPGYLPRYDDILRKGFSDWANASRGLLQFQYVSDLQGAQIECYWTSDGSRLANPAENGETRFTSDRSGILHCTMLLLTVPSMPGLPMSENRIRQITLHEIGHALGLAGHTTDPKDAMFFSSSVEDQWKDLSQKDANTIVRLYSQP